MFLKGICAERTARFAGKTPQGFRSVARNSRRLARPKPRRHLTWLASFRVFSSKEFNCNYRATEGQAARRLREDRLRASRTERRPKGGATSEETRRQGCRLRS